MALGPFEQRSTSRAIWTGQVLSKTEIVGATASASQPWTLPGTQSQPNMLHPLVERELLDSSFADMMLTENILARDWHSPEDDEAWADL